GGAPVGWALRRLSAIKARPAERPPSGILAAFDRITTKGEGAMHTRGRLWLWPLVGSIGAILISPLLSLATGQDFFYNLWLVVIMAALWAALKLPRGEGGLTMGDGTSYLVALAYVVGIVGLVVIGAWAANALDLAQYSA